MKLFLLVLLSYAVLTVAVFNPYGLSHRVTQALLLSCCALIVLWVFLLMGTITGEVNL